MSLLSSSCTPCSDSRTVDCCLPSFSDETVCMCLFQEIAIRKQKYVPWWGFATRDNELCMFFSTSGPPAIKLHGCGFLGCILQRVIILLFCQQTGLSDIYNEEKEMLFNVDLMISALLLHRAKIEYGFCMWRNYQCCSLPGLSLQKM